MATLIFSAEKVNKLAQHAIAASRHTRRYGQREDPAPALCFATEGTYLMSNGEPCSQDPRKTVVYAEGYEPPNGLRGVSKELVAAVELVREGQRRGVASQDPYLNSWAASVERLLTAQYTGSSPRTIERRGLRNAHMKLLLPENQEPFFGT